MKRSDLANFDPNTPLEKLGWAREEMQRNFQQPMSARAMRVSVSYTHLTLPTIYSV